MLFYQKDVEELQGYAGALTEVGYLSPEHHKAIATKLALDLMDNLHVPEDRRPALLKKEKSFISDAELAYVRSECVLFGLFILRMNTTSCSFVTKF